MNVRDNAKMVIAAVALTSVLAVNAADADSHGNKFVHSRSFNGQVYVMYKDHMSLYTYDKDEPGKSNCNKKCAEDWNPAVLDAGTVLGENYTLIKRADGTMQAAFRGMPLYLYSKDRKPGDISGDGVGGVWHLARP